MTLDDAISRVKELVAERERIDRELSSLFGLIETPKRGRPRKDNGPDVSEQQRPDKQPTVNDGSPAEGKPD